MKWFTGINCIEDLKDLYKRLAKQYHPDMGGDLEKMKSINAEFDDVFPRLKHIHKSADFKQSEAAYQQADRETPEMFRAIIAQLLRFDGVEIEICGFWVWLSGKTYQYKNEIKALGFNWSKGKKMWYLNPFDDGIKHKGYYSMDQIRSRYGSIKVAKAEEELRLI